MLSARFRFLPILAVALLALTLAGCRDIYEWHQKLTVTVETPLGQRSGSGIAKIVALFGRLPASSSEVEYRITGEATVVEMSPGQYLFALLDEGSKELAAATWRGELPTGRHHWLPRIPDLKGPKDVPQARYPMLVTFTDLGNPKTVRRLNPADLAATFGPGYALKGITLEITDEPVTVGAVESVLGWLHDPTYRTPPVWPSLTQLQQDTLSGMVVQGRRL
ncbi:MAG: hypothetical protein AB7I79_16875 [Rhizobiaceae bacterium]